MANNQLWSAYKENYPLELEWIYNSVGPGWRGILERLVEDLFTLGWDGQIAQVKEKFGGLRFYIGAGSPAVWERIAQAEREAYRTCEDCGAPGKLNDQGWWKTLCDECAIKDGREPAGLALWDESSAGDGE